MKILGKDVSHWTPRYAFDKARWMLFQRRNPDAPWLTPDAIRILDTLLKRSDEGIEWGSGRSTCWLAKRVGRLVSVEDNHEWYERVRGQIRDLGLTNVDYRFAPTPDEKTSATSEYVRSVDAFADGSLGFALVDGSARAQCALAAIPKLAPGGLLVIDNANWFLDHPTRSPASRYGLGHADADWNTIAKELEPWRLVWTTQGVTDTVIWIKPPRG